ncbi:Crp/Fnr family transcriptional regulator [Mucilaginibacter sp. OK283]|uniref:Crp/Fnr family transcriptional regulator n=1 Tax=Mucilaginibacter sp. OK283 TaxID=1881049 RepID=UPI0008D5D3AC|nr:Crp/Fnr family transcriptional regulator [Mucilaginibacter sp. OK283]SEP38250.1 cAMP-binding domain of CRP or a regulatory subunit of cAMP-dependent protein kinases [Mucilaginibacter sp. OK283]
MYEIFQRYIDNRVILTDAEKDRVRSVAVIKKIRKRQYLLQEGDIWKYDAFVSAGCLRTYSVDEKGNEHIIGFSIENWWSGDRESLLSGEPSRFNIDAIEDSELVLFTHNNFEMLRREIPLFDQMVNNILNKSFVTQQNRINATLSYTAEEKYLYFVKKYPEFALRVPQSMIASYLGMTPETLSRIRTQTARNKS